jgi:hypothetical protein
MALLGCRRRHVPSTINTQDSYGLEAYVCDLAITSTVNGPDGTTRAILDRISTYDLNQGEFVTVCVIPDNFTYTDGIRLNGIFDFTWTRDTPLINQEAIIDGRVASSFGASALVTAAALLSAALIE